MTRRSLEKKWKGIYEKREPKAISMEAQKLKAYLR